MTTRDQLRRAASADRSGFDERPPGERGPDDAPRSLPERLYAAREAKGVDLYRAERDTKIRARYLGALERGDYKELPGAVYTKGFLRNYALYLGLDADEILEQWRRERGAVREAAQAPVAPRPLAAPRKGLTFSPFIVVLALMTVGVLIFGAYLGVQLLRFAKPPTIAVTQPATAVVDVDDSTTSYTLRGVTLAGATVNIASPGRDPYSVTADSTGSWRAEVDLRRGRNEFDVSALDPDTGKHSEENILIYITVPFLAIEAPTLTVDQPAEGATYENGAIPVQGRTTNADSVVVSATYTGPATGTKATDKATPVAARDPRIGDGEGRRRRDVRRLVRADHGQVGDHRHRVQPRGQDDGHHAQRHGRVQGRQRRRRDQERPGVAEGLGRWPGVRQDHRGRARVCPGRHAHVPGQGVGRGPDRQVQCHVLHGERDRPRAHERRRQPRDVALRATRRTGSDRPSLTTMATEHEPLEDLARRLQHTCLGAGLTVATAESCTGGLVAHGITSVPGSSGYFLGAIVSYADRVKVDALGVPPDVLATHGAVSAQVALAMASGIRERLATDLGVGITGVAGPDGGSDEKPVGLVYVGVSDRLGTDVRRFHWAGDRAANNEASAAEALRFLAERADALAGVETPAG